MWRFMEYESITFFFRHPVLNDVRRTSLQYFHLWELPLSHLNISGVLQQKRDFGKLRKQSWLYYVLKFLWQCSNYSAGLWHHVVL
jgi:hypothetical protein